MPQIQVSSETPRRICATNITAVHQSLGICPERQARHDDWSAFVTRPHHSRLATKPQQRPSHQEWCASFILLLRYPSSTINRVTDVAVDVITIVFRTYLMDQTIDHLASTLKKGGIKDLLVFFPANKREDRILDETFRKQGIPQVADWWTKKKYAILKEGIIKAIQGSLEEGDSDEDVSLAVIYEFWF